MKFFDLFRTSNKIVLSNAAADGSRPELTVRMAEKLLGEKVQNMAMYNFKTLKPLKDTYNDQKLIYGRHKAEIDVFLELSCFFDDPVDVGDFISGSSDFSKISLNIWNFMVHVLLKAALENFEHYFTSM